VEVVAAAIAVPISTQVTNLLLLTQVTDLITSHLTDLTTHMRIAATRLFLLLS
jgi:hypothetical protein